MDVFKAIQTRRSVRYYKDKKILLDDLLLLVEMGMKAPSAGNLQDFRFIVSKEKKIIRKLPQLCMDQDWISTAAGIIIICSQPELQVKWYAEMGSRFAAQNAAAAAQNILLSAESIGLGACWVGGFDRKAVEKAFGIEGNARAEIIITVGFSDERPERKTENSIETMAFFDSYGNDKKDLAWTNKDYSIKVQRYLEDAEEQTKKSKITFKKFLQDIKKKYL